MSRYESNSIIKSKEGKRYLRNIKYPVINLEQSDIYIITEVGDSIDLLSYEYYNNVEDYWILAIANNMKGDSRFITPGTQFRIPINTIKIKQDFERLNSSYL